MWIGLADAARGKVLATPFAVPICRSSPPNGDNAGPATHDREEARCNGGDLFFTGFVFTPACHGRGGRAGANEELADHGCQDPQQSEGQHDDKKADEVLQ